MENAVKKVDILDALAAFDAGQPGKLRDLNKQLTNDATIAADAAMNISGNPVDEPGQLLSKAAARGIISRAELVALTLNPVASVS